MDPDHFVGVPDWPSALLALVFTISWLFWLGRGWLRSRWLWLSLAAGALLFPFSIAWVQVPPQGWLNAFWTGRLSPATIQRCLLLVGLVSLLVAGLVQEAAKALVAVGALRLAGKKHDPQAGLSLGAAAGVGYGGFEAFWVFNLIFAVGWSWAMVDLQGPQALLGFVERFFTVPFHIGSAALSGYGYATCRFWRFFLIAVLLHTVVNFGALLFQAQVLNGITVEIWVAVISLATFGMALWLRRKARQAEPAGNSLTPRPSRFP